MVKDVLYYAMVKNPPVNAGDAGNVGLISMLQSFPGGGNGNLLQCSCRVNPMDRESMGSQGIGCN